MLLSQNDMTFFRQIFSHSYPDEQPDIDSTLEDSTPPVSLYVSVPNLRSKLTTCMHNAARLAVCSRPPSETQNYNPNRAKPGGILNEALSQD